MSDCFTVTNMVYFEEIDVLFERVSEIHELKFENYINQHIKAESDH